MFRDARNLFFHPVGLIYSLKKHIEMIRNKGGRPTKNLAEKRKYRLSLKLNTNEYLQLKSKAKNACKNRCDILRELILSGEVKQRISHEELDLIRKISGMANNLNQLVHLAHVQGVWFIEIASKKMIDELDNLIKRIKI